MAKIPQARQERLDRAFKMLYERFRSYEEHADDIPEKHYRFKIRVYFDDSDQWMPHTLSMTGSDKFESRVNDALTTNPDAIELSELTAQNKPIQDGAFYVRLTNPKKNSKQWFEEQRAKEEIKAKAMQEKENLGKFPEPEPSAADNDVELVKLRTETKFQKDIAEKDFKIQMLTKELEDISQDYKMLERDFNEMQNQNSENSLGNVLGGFLQKNSGLVTGVLGKIAGAASGMSEPKQDGVLAGISEDRAVLVSDFATLARELDEESFMKIHTIMYSILQNPQMIDDVYELISDNQQEQEPQFSVSPVKNDQYESDAEH